MHKNKRNDTFALLSINPEQSRRIKLRSFGLAISLAASIILWRINKGHGTLAHYLILVPVILLTFAILSPLKLNFLYKIMLILANAIGTLIGWIVLVIIFYLIITPLGLLSRFTRDPLFLGKKKLNSYWAKKEEIFSKESYKRQF